MKSNGAILDPPASPHAAAAPAKIGQRLAAAYEKFLKCAQRKGEIHVED